MYWIVLLILAITAITGGVIWLKYGLLDKKSEFVTLGFKGRITRKIARIIHNAYSIWGIIAGIVVAVLLIFNILKQS